jgi:hypothetical protein
MFLGVPLSIIQEGFKTIKSWNYDTPAVTTTMKCSFFHVSQFANKLKLRNAKKCGYLYDTPIEAKNDV